MKTLIIIIVLSFLLLVSCESEKIIIVEYPNGELIGRLEAINEVGEGIEDASVVKVFAESEDSTYQGECNSAGYWKISNLPVGVYRLIFYLEGQDTAKVDNFQFVGRHSYTYPTIIRVNKKNVLGTLRVQNLSYQYSDNLTDSQLSKFEITFKAQLNTNNTYKGIPLTLFISDESDVSTLQNIKRIVMDRQNCDEGIYCLKLTRFVDNSGTLPQETNDFDTETKKFKKGDKLYARVYYQIQTTQTFNHQYHNPSEVVEFEVP